MRKEIGKKEGWWGLPASPPTSIDLSQLQFLQLYRGNNPLISSLRCIRPKKDTSVINPSNPAVWVPQTSADGHPKDVGDRGKSLEETVNQKHRSRSFAYQIRVNTRTERTSRVGPTYEWEIVEGNRNPHFKRESPRKVLVRD